MLSTVNANPNLPVVYCYQDNRLIPHQLSAIKFEGEITEDRMQAVSNFLKIIGDKLLVLDGDRTALDGAELGDHRHQQIVDFNTLTKMVDGEEAGDDQTSANKRQRRRSVLYPPQGARPFRDENGEVALLEKEPPMPRRKVSFPSGGEVPNFGRRHTIAEVRAGLLKSTEGDVVSHIPHRPTRHERIRRKISDIFVRAGRRHSKAVIDEAIYDVKKNEEELASRRNSCIRLTEPSILYDIVKRGISSSPRPELTESASNLRRFSEGSAIPGSARRRLLAIENVKRRASFELEKLLNKETKDVRRKLTDPESQNP